MPSLHKTTQIISSTYAGYRFDQAIAQLFPEYSRTSLQTWMRGGQIKVDGKLVRPRDKAHGGEEVVLDIPLQAKETWQPQAIALDIVFEDEDLLVINKPVGLVVHPGAGNREGTLLNALLHHCPELSCVPRAGIVHRLDKETSGLLVVAKNLASHHALVKQLQARQVHREYHAIVNGVMTAGGIVEEPIGRHPTQRIKMAVLENGKPAITHYRVLERFAAHTYLRVLLETGRTHQIRVHMAHIYYPIVGDATYGARVLLPKQANEELRQTLQHFKRQALHAYRLELQHPILHTHMQWCAEIPVDMCTLLKLLRDNKNSYSL